MTLPIAAYPPEAWTIITNKEKKASASSPYLIRVKT